MNTDINPEHAERPTLVRRINLLLEDKRFFLALVGVLAATQFVLRGLLYPSAPTDDAEQLYFSQVFRWGYDVVNPPLYTWLVIAIQYLTGVTVASVSLVKFPLYGLIFILLWMLARQVVDDRRLAVLIGLSPLLLYYIAWDAVLSYSHSVLATALILAGLVTFIHLEKRPRPAGYVLFGAILGFGVLSKYTFGFFALGLVIAALSYKPYRSVLLTPKTLLAIVVAAVILFPHAMWYIDTLNLADGKLAGKFEVGAGGGFLKARLKGLGTMISSGIGFASPLWLILLGLFWPEVRRRRRMHAFIPPAAKLLFILFLVSIALMILAVLALGVSKIRAHYMFIFTAFPVVFLAWLEPCLRDNRRNRAFGVLLPVTAVLLGGGMAAKYASEPYRCKRCQLLLPFEDIGRKIRDAGFKDGTIYAYYFPHDLAGNLRTVFPDTRIVSTKYPRLAPPPGEPGQCLIIWMPKPSGPMDASGMAQLADRTLGTGIGWVEFPVRTLPFTYDRNPGRADKLHYMLYDPGRGDCR